ncbi:MAG: C39 family peptidase, partial [Thermoflexales bacterium]|nr:C39 family peptidase [Thermoflexales bacterium]
MLPKPVPHREQTMPADCLAACAAMLLDYLEQPIPYLRLVKLLGIGPIGAPRRNILRLTQLGLQVTYRQATLPILADYLHAEQPVIVFLDTGELAYWSTATNHAVVLVGLEGDDVLVNDPAFPSAPQRIPRDDFELAWLNSDNACAIIERNQ